MGFQWSDQYTPNPDAPDDQTEGAEFGEGYNSLGQLRIPQNIYDWIQDASSETGTPIPVLAAAVYQKSGWNKIDPNWVYGVAQRIATQAALIATSVAPNEQGQYESSGRDPNLQGSGVWLDATANALGLRGEARTLYRNQIASTFDKGYVTIRDKAFPASGKAVSPIFGDLGGYTINYGSGSTVARKPLIPGFDDDRAEEIKAIADGVFLTYLGRRPTNDEYRDIDSKKWTRDDVTKWLKGLPSGTPGVTLGQKVQLTDYANRAALEQLGREADPGEINFLQQQGFIAPDNISAFYEQMKERYDTGDPNLQWIGDPQTFRDTRKQLQGIWSNLGLQGQVPADYVNRVVGGANVADVAESFGNLPAPGFSPDVTVSEVNRVRAIASPYWEHYFPGEKPTSAHLRAMIGQSNIGIRDYVGSLPARPRQNAAQGVANQRTAGPGGNTLEQPPATKPIVPTKIPDSQGRPASSTTPRTNGQDARLPTGLQTDNDAVKDAISRGGINAPAG